MQLNMDDMTDAMRDERHKKQVQNRLLTPNDNTTLSPEQVHAIDQQADINKEAFAQGYLFAGVLDKEAGKLEGAVNTGKSLLNILKGDKAKKIGNVADIGVAAGAAGVVGYKGYDPEEGLLDPANIGRAASAGILARPKHIKYVATGKGGSQGTGSRFLDKAEGNLSGLGTRALGYTVQGLAPIAAGIGIKTVPKFLDKAEETAEAASEVGPQYVDAISAHARAMKHSAQKAEKEFGGLVGFFEDVRGTLEGVWGDPDIRREKIKQGLRETGTLARDFLDSPYGKVAGIGAGGAGLMFLLYKVRKSREATKASGEEQVRQTEEAQIRNLQKKLLRRQLGG